MDSADVILIAVIVCATADLIARMPKKNAKVPTDVTEDAI